MHIKLKLIFGVHKKLPVFLGSMYILSLQGKEYFVNGPYISVNAFVKTACYRHYATHVQYLS